jgi:hypothetical protein
MVTIYFQWNGAKNGNATSHSVQKVVITVHPEN